MTVREHYTARYGTHKWLSHVNPENLASDLSHAPLTRRRATLQFATTPAPPARARFRPRTCLHKRWRRRTHRRILSEPGGESRCRTSSRRPSRVRSTRSSPQSPKQDLRCIDIACQAGQHRHGEGRQRERRCEGAPGFNWVGHACAHAPGIPAARAANLRRIWISVPPTSISRSAASLADRPARCLSVNRRWPDQKCRATTPAARRSLSGQAHLLPIPPAAPRRQAPDALPAASAPASTGHRGPGA